MAAVLALGAFSLAGCGSGGAGSAGGSGGSGSEGSGASAESPAAGSASGEISVYSREDGSGTRGAFVELFGIEQANTSGDKVDLTTTTAAITNSTSVMMTSVAGDANGIGYISLGSLNSSVKALEIDGAMATADNVKNGSYKVSRPFNIVTKDGLSEEAQDFVSFIMSADGQKVVEDNGYIAVAESAAAYTPTGASGKIVVAGSSSVTPVMEKLAEAYKALNPDVTIEVNQSDSTTGVQMTIEGTCDIGMASRDLKDSETSEGVQPTVIALDGIAVIVSPDSSISQLTSEQVMKIYTGEITDWSEVSRDSIGG